MSGYCILFDHDWQEYPAERFSFRCRRCGWVDTMENVQWLYKEMWEDED